MVVVAAGDLCVTTGTELGGAMAATPSSYSITMRLYTAPDHAVIGAVATKIAESGGIVTAIEEVKPKVPFVARITGTNQEEGNRILASANLATAGSAAEAAQKAVALAKG